jgi:hypothetical protein
VAEPLSLAAPHQQYLQVYRNSCFNDQNQLQGSSGTFQAACRLQQEIIFFFEVKIFCFFVIEMALGGDCLL